MQLVTVSLCVSVFGISSTTLLPPAGPMVNTTHDFWRMVWEQNSRIIIMLTNVVEKTRVRGTSALHYDTSLYITLHHITSHHITSHYITLHHITLHYITLHHFTSHYITHTYVLMHAHSRTTPAEIVMHMYIRTQQQIPI